MEDESNLLGPEVLLATLEDVSSGLHNAQLQLESLFREPMPEDEPAIEHLARLLSLGSLVSDVQTCTKALQSYHEAIESLPEERRKHFRTEVMPRLAMTRDAAGMLEKRMWTIAKRDFEDATVRMVENVRLAMKGREHEIPGNEKASRRLGRVVVQSAPAA